MNPEEQKISTEDAANTVAHLNRGKDYFKAGDYGAAIAEFDQALVLNSELGDAWFYRGNAYAFQGDFDQALADWEAAMKIDPNDASTRNNIQRVRQQRMDEVIDAGNMAKTVADYAAFSPC